MSTCSCIGGKMKVGILAIGTELLMGRQSTPMPRI